MRTLEAFYDVLNSTPPELKKLIDFSFAIANVIDARLKELNITQKELAARTGCKEPEIAKWLGGTHNFTIKTLAKISVTLGIDLIKIED